MLFIYCGKNKCLCTHHEREQSGRELISAVVLTFRTESGPLRTTADFLHRRVTTVVWLMDIIAVLLIYLVLFFFSAGLWYVLYVSHKLISSCRVLAFCNA